MGNPNRPGMPKTECIGQCIAGVVAMVAGHRYIIRAMAKVCQPIWSLSEDIAKQRGYSLYGIFLGHVYACPRFVARLATYPARRDMSTDSDGPCPRIKRSCPGKWCMEMELSSAPGLEQ